MEVTDAVVVAQVLAGDKDAFRVLVERHSRNIFHVVYRMTGNQQDAEELVQETFLRAFKSLGGFELRANFSTWLYRIAVNRTLDFLHAKKIRMNPTESCEIVEDHESGESHQVQLPATAPGPERLLLSAEMKHKIAGAMDLLTPAERVAFTMRHMEGRSIAEISQALDLKLDAAKNSVFRAVRKLRQQLAPYAGSGSGTSSPRWSGSTTK